MSTEPPSKRSKMVNSDAGPSTENPYLAHLGPKGGAGYGSGNGNGTGSNGVPAPTGKNPLNGLVPRMVTTEQAKNILVSVYEVPFALKGWAEGRLTGDRTVM